MGNKNFDVVVIGELNADLIMNKMANFPEIGKEVLSGDMNLTLGSSSAIFAANLSILGCCVSFIGKTGIDLIGDFVFQGLQSKRIDTSGIVRENSVNTGTTVVLNFNDDRAMITYPGAMDSFCVLDIDWNIVQHSRHLHLSSCFMQPALKNDLGFIFRKARQMGLTTSMDPQWDPSGKWELDLESILPEVDFFFPNEAELLRLTKSKDLQQALRQINAITNTVVVKQGSRGSTLVVNGDSKSLPAFLNEEIVDAIGAGDSFNAGFIYQFLNGKSLEACQEFGHMMAAVSTTAAGGTGAFHNKQQVFDILKNKYGYREN